MCLRWAWLKADLEGVSITLKASLFRREALGAGLASALAFCPAVSLTDQLLSLF